MTVSIANVAQGSPEWLALRLRHYGASETPAIAGLSPYQTAAEVWRAKRGHPRARPAADLVMRIGHALEPLALELAAEALGPTTLRGAVLVQDGGLLLASLDTALEQGLEPIDAKVRGAGSPDYQHYQDESIPASTALQLMQQAALIAELSGRWPEAAHVSALLGDRYGWTHRLYRMAIGAEERDRWCDQWAPYVPRWHRLYIDGERVPPDAVAEDVAVLVEPTRVQRREATDEEVALVEALAVAEAERAAADRAAREATARRDVVRDDLARRLGPATTIPRLTWKARRNHPPILTLEATR